MMQITVTAKKLDLTPGIREYAEEKIGRLERFVDGIMEAHVLLRMEKHRQIAEVTLHARHADFTGKENSDDILAAIDRVSDKLERQVRKYKTRTLNRRKGKAAPQPDEETDEISSITILGPAQAADSMARPVITEKIINLDLMTVDEAITRMEVYGNDFWVFREGASGQMSVVYRRKDDSYGLIRQES
jgi:putative sigma-54 modulation protein